MNRAGRRLSTCRERLTREGLPALLISNRSNLRYLTGFTGEGVAVVAEEAAVIITDGRYSLRAAQECPGLRIAVRQDSLNAELCDVIGGLGLEALGFEADELTVAALEDLREKLEGVELISTKGLVLTQRAKKDEDEIAKLRAATAISDRCYEQLKDDLAPGISERDLAYRVEGELRRLGADKVAFDVIAAFGPHAADPHAEPGDRELRPGDLVKLDFGARREGYNSDLTRTLVLGQPDARQREIYRIVAAAQEQAAAAVAPGRTGQEVDAVARDVIAAAGFGDQFTHGLGHGVGLDVHEWPRLGKTSEDVLEPGMVVTVEPGIYIEDWGGVRIEDMVLVTEQGAEVLTQAPKYVPGT